MITVDPKMACTFMGLCGPAEFLAPAQNPITLLLTHPESQEPEQKLIGGYYVPQTVAYLEKPGCVICEYVINELQTILGQNQTEEEIQKSLDKVCDRMPASVEEQCYHLVETYGPAIVEILSRGVSPKDVCSIMKLCNEQLLLSKAVKQVRFFAHF